MSAADLMCQGRLERRPHHARLPHGDRCQNLARAEFGGKRLCRRCAKKAQRLEMRRQLLREIVEAKWPRPNDHLSKDNRIDELVKSLLPFLGKLPG
jgi:hypothetical protein